MRFVPSLRTDMCCVFFFVCNFYGFNEHKKDQIDRDLTAVVIVEEKSLVVPPLSQECE